MDEARDLIAVLKADKERLQAEVDALRDCSFSSETSRVHRAESITVRADKQILTEVDALESSVERSTSNRNVLPTVKSESRSDATSSEDEETTEVVTPNFKHPKGFKELRFRVDKFSGDTKEIDFDVWLDDFLEATNDCGWSNADRAKWFSWFLSGPAKSTWQRTLKSTHKESWEEIVSVYRGQYGVHMDPRTAYQRCNELQYDQFKSVQGLVDSMRDYQRMAPQKLTDTVLESILWNKVPVKLQREVKEITDGSVQELLQRLLKAESIVEERERRAAEGTPRRIRRDPGRITENNQDQHTTGSRSSEPGKCTSKSDVKSRSKAEMGLQSVKCFKCAKLGHVAKDCPEKRQNQPTRRIVLSEDASGSQDPWLLMLTTEMTQQYQPDTDNPCLCAVTMPNDRPLDIKGPTYKAEVSVDGVRIRALLDHGAQVSLVRKELLPKIREKNGWTLDQCHDRNCKLEGQPTGAGGYKLGATAVVRLHVTSTDGERQHQVPCYVLESSKPIWSGELKNCAMVLGTNALEDLGFCIVTNKGSKVKPEGSSECSGPREGGSRSTSTEPCKPEEEPRTQIRIVLEKDLPLGPQQSKVAKIKLSESHKVNQGQAYVVEPHEGMLAERMCDFTEELWVGEASPTLTLTNWGDSPVVIEKDKVIGTIEEVSVITKDDPLWSEPVQLAEAVVRRCHVSGNELATRHKQLKEQLLIGESTNEDKQALLQLLYSHHQVFALSDSELGETDLVEHNIETVDNQPVRVAPRRLPYALRTELEAELTKLMNTGCIEESSSPYASGLVLVRKKDGGLRVCVDYRGLNKKTVPDCYPIPRIDEMIDTIGRQHGKVFTSLDLMKGYHQVKVADDCKSKTAFTCHMGLYQYRRMPFGLTNAPATFQRLMNRLFTGEEWRFVYVYLDDILIVSSDMEEHLGHVGKVLKRLDEAGLRLRPGKCAFAQQEIDYLGYTLSALGVRPNNKKVQAIQEFPRPTSAKAVKSFLGIVNFYRRHVKNMAAIARPLTALTRKDKTTGNTVVFEWNAECEEAFLTLKSMLVTAPVLIPPDLSKEFFLWTDASARGFGAVLEQKDDEGQPHPVAYASRQTNTAESKYAPTELEVAALIFGVEYFEVYLLGHQVTVYTDHQALVSAFISQLKGQTKELLARWYLRLSRFIPLMKLEYKPGRANVVADGLSRAPVEDSGTVRVIVDQDPVLAKVQREQRQDGELNDLIQYLETKVLPEDEVRRQKVLVSAQQGYYIVDGILYFESAEVPDRRRLVVPTHLRQRIVEEHHDPIFAGHFSEKKLLGKLKRMYYWQGMRQDTHQKCTSCVVCASVQGQERRVKPPLKSIQVGGPFECIGMDFKQMDVSHSGNRYALVFQDYLTKWPEVYAVPDRTAPTVAKCLADVIWKHGAPLKIIHDRAAEFLSDVVQETATVLGITQLPTSGGHPQTDGLVERMNRTLKQMLAKVVKKGGKDWDDMLGLVLFAYRTAPQASSGETPFSLVYGRDARVPTSLDFYQPVSSLPVLETDYAKELFAETKRARQLAKQCIGRAQKAQKHQYDKHSTIPAIIEGDLVMLRVEPKFKLDRTYRGPYRVTGVTPTNVLIRPMNDPNGEILDVSIQRVSKCKEQLSTSTPWMGHGRGRRRRQIKKAVVIQPVDDTSIASNKNSVVNTPEETRTRSGRRVRQPSRFRDDDCPRVSLINRGEVVRHQMERSGDIT